MQRFDELRASIMVWGLTSWSAMLLGGVESRVFGMNSGGSWRVLILETDHV